MKYTEPHAFIIMIENLHLVQLDKVLLLKRRIPQKLNAFIFRPIVLYQVYCREKVKTLSYLLKK